MTLALDIRADLGGFALNAQLSAPAGITVLFGPSGAGKTTVAQAVAGLLTPDAGRIEVAGEVLFDSAARINLPSRHRGIGYVFQDARLFPHLSVRRNLLYGAPDARDLNEIATLLDISPLLERRPLTLSGGEAGRVALGRALLSRPRLLILDEPLAALDAARKAEILPYLERLRDAARVPMLYVTHALQEVARLGTTLAVIRDGRVVQSGPVADVLADPGAVADLGPRAAGALIAGRITGHADGLTTVQTSAGQLFLPGPLGDTGRLIRIRIMAQDIILAAEPPKGLSALNILPCTITDIRRGQGPGAAVALLSGSDRLLARITAKSLDALALTPGQTVHAILKSTAVAPAHIGA